jgi:hypothetical protein
VLELENTYYHSFYLMKFKISNSTEYNVIRFTVRSFAVFVGFILIKNVLIDLKSKIAETCPYIV